MANFNRWDAQDEAAALLDQLRTYCQKAVDLSHEFVPPGVNAANGIFATKMVDDANMVEAIKPRSYYTGSETRQLYNVTFQFFEGMKAAFAIGTYKANVFTSPQGFVDYLVKLIPEMKKVVTDLLTIAGLNAAAIPGLVQNIGNDVQQLVDAVNKLGAKFDGEHANGHIAKAVKDTATQTLGTLVPVEATLTRAETKKYAAVLKAVCSKLEAIQLNDYDPWLNAEWQVQFEAIMRAGVEAAAA